MHQIILLLCDFKVSFSLCYNLSIDTGICSINRTAKFLISALHFISTKLRKLCSNLAAKKKNKKMVILSCY